MSHFRKHLFVMALRRAILRAARRAYGATASAYAVLKRAVAPEGRTMTDAERKALAERIDIRSIPKRATLKRQGRFAVVQLHGGRNVRLCVG